MKTPTPPKRENLKRSSPSFTKSFASVFNKLHTADPAKSVTVQSTGRPLKSISFALAFTNIESGLWKMLFTALPATHHFIHVTKSLVTLNCERRIRLQAPWSTFIAIKANLRIARTQCQWRLPETIWVIHIVAQVAHAQPRYKKKWVSRSTLKVPTRVIVRTATLRDMTDTIAVQSIRDIERK